MSSELRRHQSMFVYSKTKMTQPHFSWSCPLPTDCTVSVVLLTQGGGQKKDVGRFWINSGDFTFNLVAFSFTLRFL